MQQGRVHPIMVASSVRREDVPAGHSQGGGGCPEPIRLVLRLQNAEGYATI